MIFREVFETWINDEYVNHVRVMTLYKTKHIYYQYLDQYIGNLDINNFNKRIILALVSIFELEINPYTLHKYSNYIKSIIQKIINKTLKYAYNNELINKVDLCRIKGSHKRNKEVKVLTKEEQYKLESFAINNLDKYSYLIGIIIALYSGIRIGELCALTWDDINLSDNYILVNKSLSLEINQETNEYYYSELYTKTLHSNRKVIIPKYINKYLEIAKQMNKSNYVLETATGKRIPMEQYRYIFINILKQLNIPRIKFHALRHTYATRAIESGMDIKTISELMGHSSPSITQSIYIHISRQQLIDEMDQYNINVL